MRRIRCRKRKSGDYLVQLRGETIGLVWKTKAGDWVATKGRSYPNIGGAGSRCEAATRLIELYVYAIPNPTTPED